MPKRQYQGVSLSKKESELIQFLQTGSNDYRRAYYIYKHRKINIETDQRKITNWFNRVLIKLQKKKIALNIPFIWKGIKWSNPEKERSQVGLIEFLLNFKKRSK